MGAAPAAYMLAFCPESCYISGKRCGSLPAVPTAVWGTASDRTWPGTNAPQRNKGLVFGGTDVTD